MFLTFDIPGDNTPLKKSAVLNSHPWMALLPKAEFFIPKLSFTVSVPSTFEFVEWKHVYPLCY